VGSPPSLGGATETRTRKLTNWSRGEQELVERSMGQSFDYRLASAGLVSFDCGVSARVAVHRPDRYRHLEAPWGDARPRITRGGGYSYAAASFDTESVTIDMRRFDRILAFDSASRRIKVEAGLTLGRLLTFTTGRGLWIAQIPGYPDITVGGAIAANVQGKGAFRTGTFRHAVVDLSLFHPDLGWMTLSRNENPSAFELSSRPEESHPRALPDPCMNLSIHTAPDVRPHPWHSCQ
jgi:FAD binding domain